MSEHLPMPRSESALSAEAERLYRAHAAGLEAYLLGMLRDRNLVEDVLQQTFIKLQEHLIRHQQTVDQQAVDQQAAGLDSGNNTKPDETANRSFEAETEQASPYAVGWLYRVAYSEAMQHKRRQSLETRHEQGVAWFRQGLSPEARDELITEEEIGQVQQALSTLPEDLRRVVQMRVEQGLKFREIAEELEQPLGTVLKKMSRALEKLRKHLDRHHP